MPTKLQQRLLKCTLSERGEVRELRFESLELRVESLELREVRIFLGVLELLGILGRATLISKL